MPNTITQSASSSNDRFAIIVSEWNDSITSKLRDGAIETLHAAGIADDKIDVASVPGAWEIPLIAKMMAKSEKYAAIIGLGAVIRGETTHDQHINRAVSMAFQQISLDYSVPVLLGLLTCETLEQAIHRSGGNVGNKGAECAEAALHMAGLMKNFS